MSNECMLSHREREKARPFPFSSHAGYDRLVKQLEALQLAHRRRRRRDVLEQHKRLSAQLGIAAHRHIQHGAKGRKQAEQGHHEICDQQGGREGEEMRKWVRTERRRDKKKTRLLHVARAGMPSTNKGAENTGNKATQSAHVFFVNEPRFLMRSLMLLM